MNIYVSGSSQEAETISDYMRSLERAGHAITCDWTVPVLAATMPERDLSDDERRRAVLADERGITSAECFWLLVPETPSVGAWVELGIATQMVPMIVVSGDYRRSIFTSLANVQFDTHDEALAFILEMKP